MSYHSFKRPRSQTPTLSPVKLPYSSSPGHFMSTPIQSARRSRHVLDQDQVMIARSAFQLSGLSVKDPQRSPPRHKQRVQEELVSSWASLDTSDPALQFTGTTDRPSALVDEILREERYTSRCKRLAQNMDLDGIQNGVLHISASGYERMHRTPSRTAPSLSPIPRTAETPVGQRSPYMRLDRSPAHTPHRSMLTSSAHSDESNGPMSSSHLGLTSLRFDAPSPGTSLDISLSALSINSPTFNSRPTIVGQLRCLDAPGLSTALFGRRTVDWGLSPFLAIALYDSIYYYNLSTGKSGEICSSNVQVRNSMWFDPRTLCIVTDGGWSSQNLNSASLSDLSSFKQRDTIAFYDAVASRTVRCIEDAEMPYIASVATNPTVGHILALGSGTDSVVALHDVRCRESRIACLSLSTLGQQCSLGSFNSSDHYPTVISRCIVDQNLIAAGDSSGAVHLFDIRTHDGVAVAPETHQSPVTGLTWDRFQRNRLLSAGLDGNLVALECDSREISGIRQAAVVDTKSPITGLSLGMREIATCHTSGTVQVRSTASLYLTALCTQPRGTVLPAPCNVIATCDNAQHIAVGSQDECVRIFKCFDLQGSSNTKEDVSEHPPDPSPQCRAQELEEPHDECPHFRRPRGNGMEEWERGTPFGQMQADNCISRNYAAAPDSDSFSSGDESSFTVR